MGNLCVQGGGVSAIVRVCVVACVCLCVVGKANDLGVRGILVCACVDAIV